jgi:hypothetical protein
MKSKRIALGKVWLLESVSNRQVGWKAYPIAEPMAALVSHHSDGAEGMYPKGNKKNISCYFILARNGGLEVVEVYDWVEDRLGLILAHLESSCVQSTRLHMISAMRLSSAGPAPIRKGWLTI